MVPTTWKGTRQPTMILDKMAYEAADEDRTQSLYNALARVFDSEPALLRLLASPPLGSMRVEELLAHLRRRVPANHAAHRHLHAVDGSGECTKSIRAPLSARGLEA